MAQTQPMVLAGGRVSTSPSPLQNKSLSSPLTSESDVDDLVDIFFDVDVSSNHFSRIQSCDLQLGDSWRGMQGKMSVTAPVKKIRKKSDHKPQSQLNKCFNEKKRRELENETINQLEELLGSCLAEVKQPDKNGIVREATRQIQDVLQRLRDCPEECPARVPQCTSPVQAGEISSTQPPPDSHYSELTNLIEAVKHYTTELGWVLLELNHKGEIECITENIKDIISRGRTELFKVPLCDLLHVSDHSKVKAIVRNIETVGWPSEDTGKFQSFQARFIKDSSGLDATRFSEVVIHAAAVPGLSPEEAGSVMCVIRRCDDALAALLPVDGGPPAIPHKQMDQITFRLDCNYKILTCEQIGLDSGTRSSLIGVRILDLIDTSDRIRFSAHLREVANYPEPPTPSETFRIRVSPDNGWIRVRAQSRLFRASPTSGEVDFIMSTHTVLNNEDVNILESDENRGALIPTGSNGESSSCDNRYRSMSPSDPPFIGDFNDLDPWASAFPFEEMPEEPKERKESVSESPMTPRTPSTPVESPAAPPPVEEPNRLRTLLSKKPNSGTGAGEGSSDSNNRILKDLLKQDDEEAATSSETSAPHTPLTPHTPHTPHTPASALSPLQRPPPAAHPPHTSHNSDMLLRILNDKSDENAEDSRRNNNDHRTTSQPSALLTQLLSSSNGPSNNGRSQDSTDNYLERLAGGVKRKFDEAKGSSLNVKRATPETQQVSSSAITVASSSSTGTSPAISGGSGLSDLCQKNKILVSLLARQQPTPTPPLPPPNPSLRPYAPRPRHAPPATLPASHATTHAPTHSAPRQHPTQLTNMLVSQSRTSNLNGGMGQEGGGSQLQLVLQRPYPQQTPPSHNPHYANTAPQHLYNSHPQSGNSRAQAGSSVGGGDSEPNDQVLSDLLDEVINNLSDGGERPDGLMGNRQHRPDYRNMKEEENVINAIRQSLMQCEKASKSPVTSSPSAPPVYPVHSPSGCNMGSGMYPLSGARGGEGPARAGVEQQRARLLQMQRSQQMLVSPEAAEQPQPDLGSTISALVSATPPNVALTRTDYQHLYHSTSQIGSSYGTAKIGSTQQNTMLSRQLSGGYTAVVSHSPASLHTPMTQHYHRPPPPRPNLSGYYEDTSAGGGGYCAEYSRRAPHLDALGGGAANVGGGGGATSEYVRNELRAVVGARARPDMHPQMQQPDLDPLSMPYEMSTPGGGSVVGGRASSSTTNSWETQQNTPSTTEAVSAAAGSAARGDESATAAAAAASAAVAAAAAGAKASLLQKLLSE